VRKVVHEGASPEQAFDSYKASKSVKR
jgi:hypothetical protein